MAKNWNAAMAVEALNGSEDQRKELMMDAGRRFPITVASLVTLHSMASASETGKEAFKNIIGSLPEWVTLRKIEGVLKADVVIEDEEEEPAKPAKEEKAKKAKAKKEEEEDKPDKKKAAKKAKAKKEEEPEEEDDEEEDEPKKKASKPAKGKKAAKKVEEEEDDEDDDDDDWDE